jgi:hypothetical protein
MKAVLRMLHARQLVMQQRRHIVIRMPSVPAPTTISVIRRCSNSGMLER